MYAKKNKPMYGKGGMAKLAQYMNGGRIYAENGTQVTGAKTSRLTGEEARQAEYLYRKFAPFFRTEDFRAGFGGNELYKQIQKFAKDINKDVSPRAVAAIAQLAMDSDRVPVNQLNVDELEYSMPEKKLMMGNGGTVKYRSGGMMKYEQGGPVGSASSDQKFRVIPEKSPTGQTELAYYIDGRPVESQDFMEQFYAVGNKPQDLNQLIENSVIASKQGVGAESLISGGSPMEGLMKQYRDALKERNVYREQGAAGIDSLYNARNENYEEMLRRMGG